MAQKKNQNLLYTLARIIYMVMRYPIFFQHNIKGSVIEFDLEYPNELGELHSDYTLPPDKVKIKREILSNDQLRIAHVYNVPISNVKKLMRNFI